MQFVGNFVTVNKNTQSLLRLIEKVSESSIPILIQGESGTGKELIASRIHQSSLRKEAPLISVNCSAIHESLFLSELFGHEKGSFTGATSLKKGLVELAHKGTLFLDEIGEMSMEAQSKLLRFLEQGEIYRVGGKYPLRLDVRILSATNRNLLDRVKKGLFREDLFYRINALTLRVPALRERKEDILVLFQHFVEAKKMNLTLSGSAESILVRYSWPGNVRELRNVVERLCLLAESHIVSADEIRKVLPYEEGNFKDERGVGFSLREVERTHILKVLNHFRGNKTKAAIAMGITVKTLYNKLSEYERPSDLPNPPLN